METGPNQNAELNASVHHSSRKRQALVLNFGSLTLRELEIAT